METFWEPWCFFTDYFMNNYTRHCKFVCIYDAPILTVFASTGFSQLQMQFLPHNKTYNSWITLNKLDVIK